MVMEPDALTRVQTVERVNIIRVSPTVTAGAYSANDVVGGLLTFAGVKSGILRAVMIKDLAKQAGAYQLLLFESAPTAIADNDTFDVADADLSKVIAAVHIADSAGADKFDLTDNKIYYRGQLDMPIKSTTNTIYGFLIALGTPTYAAVTDVTVALHIEE